MKLAMPGTPKNEPAPGPPPVDVSPGELQPGPSRIVGAGLPVETPLPTNQWAAILVPSNDVIDSSVALAAGAKTRAATVNAAAGSRPPMTRLHMAATVPAR